MRDKLYFSYLFYFAAAVSTSASETIEGQFDVKGDSPVFLKHERGDLTKIPSGPAKLEFEKKGWFFSSELELTTAKGVFKFKVPKSSYASESRISQAKAETNGQPYTRA